MFDLPREQLMRAESAEEKKDIISKFKNLFQKKYMLSQHTHTLTLIVFQLLNFVDI